MWWQRDSNAREKVRKKTNKQTNKEREREKERERDKWDLDMCQLTYRLS